MKVDLMVLGAIEAPGDEDEAVVIAGLQAWLLDRGFSYGDINHEVPAADGSQAAVLDVAWPSGVQSGLSEPAALLLNEPPDVIAAAGDHGYRVFTTVAAFRDYCENLALVGANAPTAGD